MARIGELALALLLSARAAVALRAAPTKPSTAFCIAGNARTLPTVSKSLEKFVKRLGGAGLGGGENADVFTYITLDGAQPKGQKGWNFIAANVSEEDVAEALRPVAPVTLVTTRNASEVTDENIGSYVHNRKECFSSGYWHLVPAGMARTMNQLVHWQRCVDLIVEEEQRLGKQYEVVVITRPDIQYDTTHSINLKAVAKEGSFLAQKDWVMIMPRRVAGLLLSERARPLTCNVGEPCCKTVGQSEILWEYLMGVRVDNRGSCNCGPGENETGPLRTFTDQPFGRIKRPASSDA